MLNRSIISITEGILEYTGTSKDIGLYLYCRPFKLSISEIKYIILSPRLVIDDEEAYLLFIDKNYQKYVLPLFHTSNVDLIENLCRTRITGDLYFDKFSYESHYGKVDMIVYPERFQWKPAYKNDWKLFIRILYTWILPKSFFGTLIEY